MADDQVSLNRLKLLHPLVRQSAIDAYLKACKITPKGVHPFITETYRSFERSDELYAQGRTKPGNIVTNAKAGNSLHNYSLAIDFTLVINGKTSWKVDENWMKVVKCFEEEGWSWGGKFNSIKDYPHFEKKLGLTLSQIKAKYKINDFIEGGKYINV